MVKTDETKGHSEIRIWSFLNEIPAGTMFVPLVISSILVTLTVHSGLEMSLWDYLGEPMKSLFGPSGQMLVIGLMLFCTGTMITTHDFVDVAERGIWVILARLVPAYAISAFVYVYFGPDGFAGIDAITLICCLTSANAALYMGIIKPYADEPDRGAFPIMLIFSMPLLPFIFLSYFGSGNQGFSSEVMQVLSLLIPFFLGVLLGNLDPKIKEVFKGGNTILLPFLGFQFGSSIDLVNAFKGEIILVAILLTLIYWAVTIIIPFIVDRFVLKRPGYAAMGSTAIAGVSLVLPSMVSDFSFDGQLGSTFTSNAVSILAFVLLITNVLAPFFTKWMMNAYFQHHKADANRVFSETHPELLAAVYDENGNYRNHHHNHKIFSTIFRKRSHSEDGALVQVSTLNALMEGDYRGSKTVKEILRDTDTGVGTYNGLDGEAIIYNGHAYVGRADGEVSEMGPDETFAFSATTRFDDSVSEDEIAFSSIEDLKAKLDNYLDSHNYFFMIKMNGVFDVKVRSNFKQKEPYEPLYKVASDQREFDYENIEGFIVGIFSPNYVEGMNLPGWHVHFLSKDLKKGGHILEVSGNAKIKINKLQAWKLLMPEDPDFSQWNLKEDLKSKTEAVEGASRK
ncbi:acetolactate decarboxylase [Roseibium polysiphoniae]|uniref:Alpha-acetolactate decarboxylase n=1 Tax=Roseibium polysiphoniae TaxID=2571221 RepID=A0ABR9CA70_9HYPH|nr:acetolactate decarboxylase [Roseibium polysiphoniae]MBD8875797.1 acetolactate decarboxylase [Roseibium polysiphoniae]